MLSSVMKMVEMQSRLNAAADEIEEIIEWIGDEYKDRISSCGQPIGGQVCKEKWDEVYKGMSHFISIFMQKEVNILNNKTI